MPDRRDFRFVFLCATSGITGWSCSVRRRRPELPRGVLATADDPSVGRIAKEALAAHGGGR